MMITMSGRSVATIAGVVVTETAITCVALAALYKATKKANEKSFEAAVYKFTDYVKDLRIKDLEKEIAKLKSEHEEES